MSAGRKVRLGLLQAGSAILAVGVAVASNQILNQGVWTWWWAPIAAVLAALGAGVTFLLTRPSATPRSEHDTGQVVSATSASETVQVQDVHGNARLRSRRTPAAPKRSPLPADAPSSPDEASHDAEPQNTKAGQTIRDSRIDGTIIQARGIGGDIEISES